MPVNLRFVFIFIAVTSPLMLTAQLYPQQQRQQTYAFELWHQGKIVLESSDTVKGQIKYNLQNDLIQFEYKGQLQTYTPRKVVFFEIFDKTVNRFRQFYSLPFSDNGTYKAPVFFELLTEGKLTLLSREAMEYKTYSSGYYYGSYTRLVLVYKYFFLKEDGSINPFTGSRNDLFDLMGTYGDDVKKYTKQNKIDFDKKYGLVAIVEHYNSLFK